MIDPIAFEAGPFHVRWYGIIMTAAFMTGTILAYRRATRVGMNPEHIINIITLIIPSAIIGARLYYVIFTWSEYSYDPLSVLAIWQGGLAIHGGILGGVLAGLWYVRKHGLHLWNTADILAPSLILGQAIGRGGNFINQEAHGGAVSLEFIRHFPNFIKDQMYIDGRFYNPTFLYESAWDFGVFLFLIYYWPRQKISGEVSLLYLILYSAGRFVIEGLRTDSLMLGPIRVAQIISLILIIAGISAFYMRRRNACK